MHAVGNIRTVLHHAAPCARVCAWQQAYSQDAVAQLVITFMLNWSSSLIEQQRLIWAGDRTNGFSAPLRTPHFELGGKTIGLIGGRGNIGRRVAAIAKSLGMTAAMTRLPAPLHMHTHTHTHKTSVCIVT